MSMTNVHITFSCSYGQNAPLPPFGTAATVALHSKSLFTVGFSSLTISRRSWSIQSCCTRGDNHIGRGRMKTRSTLHPSLLSSTAQHRSSSRMIKSKLLPTSSLQRAKLKHMLQTIEVEVALQPWEGLFAGLDPIDVGLQIP